MSAVLPQVPEDFDEFWSEIVSEAKAASLDYRRSFFDEGDLPGHTLETLEFRGIHGERLYGWLAVPRAREGRVPGFLWIPPYGRESVLPNQYGTRPGFASISWNFHGLGAYHQESYNPGRGYFAQGVESPETWIFRTMFQNAYLVARILQSMVEIDEDRIAACGMSQGAGIAIWMGAHCPIIRAVCADMPFLAGYWKVLDRQIYRYPLKELADFADSIPLGMERVKYTISYYDTLNQATRCQVPTLVSLGEKDPSVRPASAMSVFEALPGKKQLIRYPGGHDWDPQMVENNLHWLAESLG